MNRLKGLSILLIAAVLACSNVSLLKAQFLEQPQSAFESFPTSDQADCDLEQWANNQIVAGFDGTSPSPDAGTAIQFSPESHASVSQFVDLPIVNPGNGFMPIESDIEAAVRGTQEVIDFGGEGIPPIKPPTFVGRLWEDELHFYSPRSLAMIGGGLVVGAAFANTNWDSGIQSHLHSSLHHANTDEWLETLHANKELGDGHYTLPVFAGAWALGKLLPNNEYAQTAGTWGERSVRGFVVGAPALLFLQMATGGSRPGETNHGSEWEPFQDNNGVSGHSFMGALPFITAAKMTESRVLKTTFYAASTLAPLSRTGDGAHYPSQVMLGWWMAYVAASAVHATDNPRANWKIYPTATSNSTGMLLEYRY